MQDLAEQLTARGYAKARIGVEMVGQIDLGVDRWSDLDPEPEERQGEIAFMVGPRLLQKVAEGDFG